MGKALDGVRILDFTHVQSGPTCTQLLAWFGADVIKIERPGTGDITRGQLRDIPNVDSLYFTMLNHNKRSITLDAKHPKGKEVLEALVRHCDVLVENFAPGALDRMGLGWERVQELLNARSESKTRKVKHDFAYKGLVRCGHCGCSNGRSKSRSSRRCRMARPPDLSGAAPLTPWSAPKAPSASPWNGGARRARC